MNTTPPIAVDVAVIGHFARDKLVFREQETISSGGSVYYGAIALRRIGLSVAVITRLRAEDFPHLDELKQEGIFVFARPAEQTSGIENVYTTEDMDRRICKPLGFAGPFRLEDIPDIAARVFLVGPIIAGEVNLELVRALAERGPVALDVQGFVRVREGDDLVFRDWPQKAEGLAYVHTLKVDSAEAEVLTGKTDPVSAVRELAAYGPREIVLTQASGVLVYADGHEYRAPFTPKELKGRTGRGDTCFACYVGKRLTASPEEACHFAAAVTTLKLEKPGPFRGTLEDVERYLAG
ncbi:MAG: PfkB family carbohydrate kinase [Anaerolineae bacterium]|nr:PfkB family carbohydrate kinase [Anaerolineae bacterium]MDH7474261.1 PfkB family carbohydrate kinase [Anaerolineae bacterium]